MEEMFGERIQRIAEEQFLGTIADSRALHRLAYNVQQAILNSNSDLEPKDFRVVTYLDGHHVRVTVHTETTDGSKIVWLSNLGIPVTLTSGG